MSPAMLIHWLPRVADHLIVFLTAQADAIAAGDTAAAHEHAEGAQDLAALAWKQITAARRMAAKPIARPAIRLQPRRNDIHLPGSPIGDHPALPPRSTWPR